MSQNSFETSTYITSLPATEGQNGQSCDKPCDKSPQQLEIIELLTAWQNMPLASRQALLTMAKALEK